MRIVGNTAGRPFHKKHDLSGNASPLLRLTPWWPSATRPPMLGHPSALLDKEPRQCPPLAGLGVQTRSVPMHMLDSPRSAASLWSPLSLRGAAAIGFASIVLLFTFAMLTAIAFYLFDVQVTVAWQESSPPQPVEAPIPVSQEIETRVQ